MEVLQTRKRAIKKPKKFSIEIPPVKKRRKNESGRETGEMCPPTGDTLPDGTPFSCDKCGTSYICDPFLKKSKKRKKPSARVVIDKETGKTLTMCNACGLRYTRMKPAPKEKATVSSDQLANYTSESHRFTSSLASLLSDPQAELLCCPNVKPSICGCIQRYISDPGHLIESKAKNLLHMVKEANKLKRLSVFETPENQNMKEKRKRGTIGFGNGLKRNLCYQYFVLDTRRGLRNEHKICEKACQKLLGYCNNFLYKRLKTENDTQRIKTISEDGAKKKDPMKEISSLPQTTCCFNKCVTIAVKFEKLLENWRERAQTNQSEARQVIAEMLTPSGGNRTNCYNFINWVTGCCKTTIKKVKDQLMKSGGVFEPPEHGLKQYHEELAQKKRTLLPTADDIDDLDLETDDIPFNISTVALHGSPRKKTKYVNTLRKPDKIKPSTIVLSELPTPAPLFGPQYDSVMLGVPSRVSSYIMARNHPNSYASSGNINNDMTGSLPVNSMQRSQKLNTDDEQTTQKLSHQNMDKLSTDSVVAGQRLNIEPMQVISKLKVKSFQSTSHNLELMQSFPVQTTKTVSGPVVQSIRDDNVMHNIESISKVNVSVSGLGDVSTKITSSDNILRNIYTTNVPDDSSVISVKETPSNNCDTDKIELRLNTDLKKRYTLNYLPCTTGAQTNTVSSVCYTSNVLGSRLYPMPYQSINNESTNYETSPKVCAQSEHSSGMEPEQWQKFTDKRERLSDRSSATIQSSLSEVPVGESVVEDNISAYSDIKAVPKYSSINRNTQCANKVITNNKIADSVLVSNLRPSYELNFLNPVTKENYFSSSNSVDPSLPFSFSSQISKPLQLKEGSTGSNPSHQLPTDSFLIQSSSTSTTRVQISSTLDSVKVPSGVIAYTPTLNKNIKSNLSTGINTIRSNTLQTFHSSAPNETDYNPQQLKSVLINPLASGSPCTSTGVVIANTCTYDPVIDLGPRSTRMTTVSQCTNRPSVYSSTLPVVNLSYPVLSNTNSYSQNTGQILSKPTTEASSVNAQCSSLSSPCVTSFINPVTHSVRHRPFPSTNHTIPSIATYSLASVKSAVTSDNTCLVSVSGPLTSAKCSLISVKSSISSVKDAQTTNKSSLTSVKSPLTTSNYSQASVNTSPISTENTSVVGIPCPPLSMTVHHKLRTSSHLSLNSTKSPQVLSSVPPEHMRSLPYSSAMTLPAIGGNKPRIIRQTKVTSTSVHSSNISTPSLNTDVSIDTQRHSPATTNFTVKSSMSHTTARSALPISNMSKEFSKIPCHKFLANTTNVTHVSENINSANAMIHPTGTTYTVNSAPPLTLTTRAASHICDPNLFTLKSHKPIFSTDTSRIGQHIYASTTSQNTIALSQIAYTPSTSSAIPVSASKRREESITLVSNVSTADSIQIPGCSLNSKSKLSPQCTSANIISNETVNVIANDNINIIQNSNVNLSGNQQYVILLYKNDTVS